MFGRKQNSVQEAGTARAEQADNLGGHRAVLEMLRREEKDKPQQRAALAAATLFDRAYYWMATPEKGTRIEDLLGMLASTGGYSCIVSTLEILQITNKSPKDVGMIHLQTKDGSRYYFGDVPNKALWESHLSLLSLTLGAAQDAGGDVSAAMVEDAMARSAKAAGTPQFGSMEKIPARHRPGDSSLNYVRNAWPHILDTLNLYEVAADQRATCIGFAIQRAIDGSKAIIDPGLAAQICVECAVPMAKLDPAYFLPG